MGRFSLRAGSHVLLLAALCAALLPATAFAATTADEVSYSYERTECPEDVDGWYDISVLNSDGSALREVTLNGRDKDQSWAPDGSRMVTLHWEKHPVLYHPRQLMTMRADGSDAHVLVTWPRSITDVAWSSVSPSVMVVADHDSDSKTGRIVYYNVKTGKRTVLYTVTDGSIIIDMAWSPDGQKIAFCQRRKSVDRSRTLTVASRKTSATAMGSANTNSVTWSRATGEQAFAVNASIRIVSPSGGVSTLVGLGGIGGISWSPAGDALTFDGARGAESGIFTITRDGGQIRQLRQDNRSAVFQRDTAFDPAWRPKPTRTAPRFAVTFPTSSAYYGPVEITYRLLAEDGSPIAGKTVVLQSSSDGRSWGTMATRATDANGRVSTWARPTKLRYYRAFYAGDGQNAQTTSAIGAIKPRVDLSAPKVPSSVRKGAYFNVSGTLRPQHKPGSTRTSPVRLYFFRWETSGGTSKWVLRRISTAKVSNTASGSKYATKVSLPFKGSWAVRAYHPVDSLHAATYSAERRLTVR